MGTDVALVYSPAMDAYDLGASHPLRPARVTNSVGLMDAYGLLGDGGAQVVEPEPASYEDLTRVHSPAYVDAVKRASADPNRFMPTFGLGTSDNPVCAGMHEVGELICGGAIRGLDDVLDGRFLRTFNVAGGLHHAHHARAAGFCVYNDPAVGIASALAKRPTLKIMYLDIDAHHGDGVEEAFWEEARVLTVSLHESGRFLFPGTGWPDEVGGGDGLGFAANVPLPPLATDDCYEIAFDQVVAPLARSFVPDAIVLQAGADANHADPLTTLGMTLGGFLRLTANIRDLADEVCQGKLAASGGGGYAFCTAVPAAWTILLANMLDRVLPEEIPGTWDPDCTGAPDMRPPTTLTRDDEFRIGETDARRLSEATSDIVAKVRKALGPYHDLD